MNNTVIPGTQFSIYKIDPEKVIEEFFPDDNSPTNARMLKALNNSIEYMLGRREQCIGLIKLRYRGFCGYLYKTMHDPDWKATLSQILENNELAMPSFVPEDFLNNVNISYVLFYTYKDCIYVMTGGFGSKLIAKYIEKNYGMYLLPKFLRKEDAVVKHVNENNLIGNRASTHRTNRATTSFQNEQDLSSIYKELAVEIDRDLAIILGIELDEDEPANKQISLSNKDSLVIRRSLSLDDLSTVLHELNSLEKKKDKFALNYLVLVKKKGLKKGELTQQLIEEFKNNDYCRFLLVGDDYEKYILGASKYQIIREDMSIFISSNVPITLRDVFTELENQSIRFSYSLFRRLLKEWQIVTFDRNGKPILYPHTLFYVIQGFIEFGESGRPCYLINGDWYTFDEKYSDLLDKEYHELFKHKMQKAKHIIEQYKLDIPVETETAYNKALKRLPNIIVAHKALYQNVEFADAIFWDDNTLYLMHNKGEFNGIGTRDLINQMLTAAECLQRNLSTNGYKGLPQYYRAICQINRVQELPQIDRGNFIKLYNTKKICYVAGFIDGFKANSNSTYAKYLTIEANKRMSEKGFDFIPLGINNDPKIASPETMVLPFPTLKK